MKPTLTRLALAAGLALALPLTAIAQQPADTGMKKDAMGMKKDAMGMKHDAMAMVKGTFAGADGHQTSGSYEIVEVDGKHVLKTSADLSVDPGAPDVYVVLSNGPKVGKKNAVWLGKMTSHMGVQAFTIPAGAKLDGKNTVVLWCKKYSATIGVADFDPSTLMHDAMKKDAMKKDAVKPQGGR